MSHSRIVLPATGGGLLVAGFCFNEFFLGIASILLGIVFWKIISNLYGEKRRRASVNETVAPSINK